MLQKRILIAFVAAMLAFSISTLSALAQIKVPGDHPVKPMFVEQPDLSSAIHFPLNETLLSASATVTNSFVIDAYPDTKLALTYNGGNQFYGGNASGLFLWIEEQVYGPSSIPAGHTHNNYTTLGNSQGGDGSNSNPWTFTTTVEAPSTGISLQSVMRYVSGDDTISFQTSVHNDNDTQRDITLFHAGDLYLQFPNNQSDYGYGTFRAATGGIGGTTSTGDYAFLFEPIYPDATAYQESYYYVIWDAIGTTVRGSGFDNTFRTDYHDAGAGLQWAFTIPAGGSHTIYHQLRLERVDLRPLDPNIDALGFDNWSEPTPLSRRQFVETFGGGGTCLEEADICTLDPAAEQWYSANFANAGQGGHCYGMSVMTSLFYRGIHSASEYDASSSIPFSLTRPNQSLEEQISIYHTYQSDFRIAAEVNATRSGLSPNGILTRIRTEIANNNLNPYILAIYGQVERTADTFFGIPWRWEWVDAGHAIVPYKIEDLDNSISRVYVYDSNHPGDQNRYVQFDMANNTWQYNLGFPGARPIGSFGTQGAWAGDNANRNLSQIHMSLHTGQKPQLPYRIEPTGGTDWYWIATDPNWQGSIVIEDEQRNRLGVTEGSLINQIPGAIPVIPMNGGIEPAPISFYLPVGRYQAVLESSVLTPTQSELRLIGPEFSFVASSIDLSATSQDTITVGAQFPDLMFSSSDGDKEVDLSYTYSLTHGSPAGRVVELTGVELGRDNGFNTRLNLASNEVYVDSLNAKSKVYDVRITTTSDLPTGTLSVFSHRNLVLLPDTIQVLDISALGITDEITLTVVLSDGTISETHVLENEATLTVSKSGNGSGQISSNPLGINCGDDCAAEFLQGTVVTLTATADLASLFDGWSGDCQKDGPLCILALNGDIQITATFSIKPYVHFSTVAYTVTEGAGTFVIPVALSAPSAFSATVEYAFGTNALGTTATGQLTFAPGETTQSLVIPITDDTLDEADEVIPLLLRNPVNAMLGDPAAATLTVVDDDPPPTVQFSSATYSATENAGQVAIAVNLSAPSGLTVTVGYSSSDDATLTGTENAATSGTLTYAPGETEKSFSVPILDDLGTQPERGVNLVLSNPVNATLGELGAAVLTILDVIRTQSLYLPVISR